ncbi:hypothetical protein PHYBLDRAFT_170473 [Phycomyces blakesleeanus NRRL 1555(-)]|uniref:Uncharacterized protein n=1 Tax=Phycomyces blakesleeanus (strain ATCC 8743b / DSM 1359 / FGSC 10004 / NBRC 33097 / NRRL 1555) TaxID=763407 RepID=A0A162TXN6_PHYB8|nr:hypothetical protein PHYBLDRAFT_170473 [Phycomyces blakesleeanus NRRL 1555(-)]OAD71832.1 hypothetical protein PHYBLDRAFT_170473 [Phycomyces blakesleeanus NRRL 1555(-)]|eukprot:XP_018289872.1 hypothetical protein PHYBLDRAFT_170473 [Phycomyces blakesleeanus NRRL 1555(-)]
MAVVLRKWKQVTLFSAVLYPPRTIRPSMSGDHIEKHGKVRQIASLGSQNMRPRRYMSNTQKRVSVMEKGDFRLAGCTSGKKIGVEERPEMRESKIYTSSYNCICDMCRRFITMEYNPIAEQVNFIIVKYDTDQRNNNNEISSMLYYLAIVYRTLLTVGKSYKELNIGQWPLPPREGGTKAPKLFFPGYTYDSYSSSSYDSNSNSSYHSTSNSSYDSNSNFIYDSTSNSSYDSNSNSSYDSNSNFIYDSTSNSSYDSNFNSSYDSNSNSSYDSTSNSSYDSNFNSSYDSNSNSSYDSTSNSSYHSTSNFI